MRKMIERPANRAHPEMIDRIGRLIADGPTSRPPLIAVVGAQGVWWIIVHFVLKTT